MSMLWQKFEFSSPPRTTHRYRGIAITRQAIKTIQSSVFSPHHHTTLPLALETMFLIIRSELV